MSEKLSEVMQEQCVSEGLEYIERVVALEARLEAMESKITKAVDYIMGEDDPDAPGKPWAIQHIIDILRPAEEGEPGPEYVDQARP